MSIEPQVLLPSSIAGRIVASGVRWGTVDLRVDEREGLYVVSGFSKQQKVRLALPTPWLQAHYSNSIDAYAAMGVWYRVAKELHVMGREAVRRAAGIKIEFFRERVEGGWRVLPQNASLFALTLA